LPLPSQNDRVNLRRALTGSVATLAVALAASACSGSSHPAASASPTPRTTPSLTFNLPASDAREVLLPASDAGVDGNLQLTPLGVECGITYQIGTHAEVDYSGQLCRLHLAVQNLDKSVHAFETTAQRLVDTDGVSKPPDHQAMGVARQVDPVQLGGNAAAVVTLYFELAKGKTPKEIQLHGDNDPTGIGTTVTAPHSPHGVVLVIPRQALYKPNPI
jgi:hypothetical protein